MPKIVDHEAYRTELLVRSFDLFARTGFAAATMRGLARELGVSTGTLYHYFETKESLFEQMVDQLAAQDVVEAVAAMPVEASPRIRLRALMRFVAANEKRMQNLLFVVVDFQRQQGGEGANRAVEAYRAAIRSHLDTRLASLTELIFSAIVGALFQRILAPNAVDFDVLTTTLEALLPPDSHDGSPL
jgi:AcrR family transcriptional regulator